MNLDPSGRCLYVLNRAPSTITSYVVDALTGLLTLTAHTPVGAGPRHFQFDPSGRWLLIGTERCLRLLAAIFLSGSVGMLSHKAPARSLVSTRRHCRSAWLGFTEECCSVWCIHRRRHGKRRGQYLQRGHKHWRRATGHRAAAGGLHEARPCASELCATYSGGCDREPARSGKAVTLNKSMSRDTIDPLSCAATQLRLGQ